MRWPCQRHKKVGGHEASGLVRSLFFCAGAGAGADAEVLLRMWKASGEEIAMLCMCVCV